MTKHARVETGRRRFDVVPTRDDLLDGGFVLVLTAFALLGFRTTFSGSFYLMSGIAGIVLGLLIAHLANVLRQPMISVLAMTLVVFFLAGGAIALRSDALVGVLPSGATFHGLADETIHGWKDLLTTLPPVDGSGPLLVLPYLLGLFGGVGAFSLARRTTPSFAPIAPPLAVLVAVILLGELTPAAQALQGGLFGALSLGWAALRAQRLRPAVQSGTGRRTRFVTAVVLLALAGGGAVLIGPHVPGAGNHRRVVLRSYVKPPSNLDQYPSPLAGFRRYKKPDLVNQVLFKVSGLPDGQAVRIATLDNYNGSVWSATDTAGSQVAGVQDAFQRIGVGIRPLVPGKRVSYTVTIPAGGYDAVWLPDAGEITSITFHGAQAGSHAEDFRYNLATQTGVVLDGLTPGASYTVHAVLPPSQLTKTAAPAGTSAQLADQAAFLATRTTQLAGAGGSPMQKLAAVEQKLRSGYYSDGLKPGELQYLPGHYQSELSRFLLADQLVGDDEQYAAAFALMLNSQSIGIPSRVVFGALPRNGVVTGADVHAWVEIELTDGSWRTIPTADFTPNQDRHPKVQLPQQPPPVAGQQVPPPVVTHPKGDDIDASNVVSSASHDSHRQAPKHAKQAGLPGWLVAAARWGGPPVLLVLLISGLIIGGKALRRRRRRTRGSPATRLSRGWREVVDHARDLGTTLPGGHTRREQATLLAAHDVAALAHAADAQIFGPGAPDDAAAAHYWSEVHAARRRMSRAVGRWRRLRAALSLASLRRDPAAEATS